MLSVPKGKAAVLRAAVHEAPAAAVAPAGVHATAAPRLLPLFRNCTVPDGPADELLFELMVAVSVTVPPKAILATLDATLVAVAAFETVSGTVEGPLEL